MTGALQTLLERSARISNRELFAVAWIFVVTGGLVLQLFILPVLVPFAHAGHGLIANQDSVGFHSAAAAAADRIRERGWEAWQWLPGDFPVALTSAVYAVIYPEPWVLLPLNGVFFGIIVVAVRSAVRSLTGSAGASLVAVAPFFVFPSFVPIWGQLHRDLVTGAGFSLVLCALILSAQRPQPAPALNRCIILALAGMGLLSLSRSYAMALTAAATIIFVLLRLRPGEARSRSLLATACVVILAALPAIGQRSTAAEPRGNEGQSLVAIPKADDGQASPTVATPAAVARSPSRARPREAEPDLWARVRALMPVKRKVDTRVSRYENCSPSPTSLPDRFLFNLCIAREGFVIDGAILGAGSVYDHDRRLRSVQDFIAYAPRAIQIALTEPGPGWWSRAKRSTVGQLGHAVIPFEMIAAYVAFVLGAVFGGRQLLRPQFAAPVGFCLTYILFYVLAIPQMGTLYRMRAFAFAILIGTAIALALGRVQVKSDVAPAGHIG
jgi:hypothetical protein